MGVTLNLYPLYVAGPASTGVQTQPQAAQPGQAPAAPVDQFHAARSAAGGGFVGALKQFVQSMDSMKQMLQQYLGQAQGGGVAVARANPQAGGLLAAAAAAGAAPGLPAASQAFWHPLFGPVRVSGNVMTPAPASEAEFVSTAAYAPTNVVLAAEPMAALQARFGPWQGRGVNTFAPKSPQAAALVVEAYSMLRSGDTAVAARVYADSQKLV